MFALCRIFKQVSCSLFLLNAILALILLPPGNSEGVGDGDTAAVTAAAKKKFDDVDVVDDDNNDAISSTTVDVAPAAAAAAGSGERERGTGDKERASSPSPRGRFVDNFKKACSSRLVLQILTAKLGYGFLMRALGSQNFVG